MTASNVSVERNNHTKPTDAELNQYTSVDTIKPQVRQSIDNSQKLAETGKGSSILSSMSSTDFTKGQENATALQESMRVNAQKWSKLKEKQNFKTIS